MPTDTHRSVGYPIPLWAVSSVWRPSSSWEAAGVDTRSQRRDLALWLLLTLLGLGITLVAVRTGAELGTASAPFLGSYRISLGGATVLAPAVAALTIVATARGFFERVRFGVALTLAYVGSLAWAIALALVDGAAGLTRSLSSANNYLTDVPAVGDDPLRYVRQFVADAA